MEGEEDEATPGWPWPVLVTLCLLSCRAQVEGADAAGLVVFKGDRPVVIDGHWGHCSMNTVGLRMTKIWHTRHSRNRSETREAQTGEGLGTPGWGLSCLWGFPKNCHGSYSACHHWTGILAPWGSTQVSPGRGSTPQPLARVGVGQGRSQRNSWAGVHGAEAAAGLPPPKLTCLGCRVEVRGLQTVTRRRGVQGGVSEKGRHRGSKRWDGVRGESGPAVRGLGVNSGLWEETEFTPDVSRDETTALGQY